MDQDILWPNLKIPLIFFARFMSSRRSLLIFARFYELQALTDDIFTFLGAPGAHCIQWARKVYAAAAEK